MGTTKTATLAVLAAAGLLAMPGAAAMIADPGIETGVNVDTLDADDLPGPDRPADAIAEPGTGTDTHTRGVAADDAAGYVDDLCEDVTERIRGLFGGFLVFLLHC